MARMDEINPIRSAFGDRFEVDLRVPEISFYFYQIDQLSISSSNLSFYPVAVIINSNSGTVGSGRFILTKTTDLPWEYILLAIFLL